MALITAEGFDQGSNGLSLVVPGFGLSGTLVGNARTASDRYAGDDLGNSAWASVNSQYVLNFNIGASSQDSTITGGVAVTSGSPADGYVGDGVYVELFRIFDASGNRRATVWLVGASGSNRQYKIEVRAGTTSGGTLLATSSTAVVDSTAWFYVETQYVCDASAGAVTVRVDETVVASASGINTTGGFAGTEIGGWHLVIPNVAGIAALAVDDFYATNTAGPVNTGFLGDVRCLKLRTNAAGSDTEWTPTGAASNFENVNNTGPLVSTVYNAESTVEGTDYYGLTDLPASATGAILGVIHRTCAWVTVSGARYAALIKDSSTEEEQTPTRNLGTTAPTGQAPGTGTNVLVIESKPSGGAWTTAEINALQVGQRLKTLTGGEARLNYQAVEVVISNHPPEPEPSTTPPPLRQRQRDDGLATSGPRQRIGARSSKQRSLRQGWRNTYMRSPRARPRRRRLAHH